jgi:beta-barrel assembly-enhancing protease
MVVLRNLALLGLFAFSALFPVVASAKKCKSDRDVAAIGHRHVPCGAPIANWYSVEKEKQLGAELSAAFDKNTKFVDDAETVAYITRLAQTLAQNSDSTIPIAVRVIDSDNVYGISLAGGYQYLTFGLLLKMQSEGELGSALARGIAHTALRSATRELTQANLLKMAGVPLQGASYPSNTTSASDLGSALALLKFRRDDELRADYFGIQYLYKAGYDPDCFIRFVETVWPSPSSAAATRTESLSVFPPTEDRIKHLREEAAEILPSRNGAVTDTPEFGKFREHLLSLSRPTPAPPATIPILHRQDPRAPQ